MDCRLIREQLVAYHFATLSDAERAGIEEHLVACGGCLRAYLGWKRDIESGAWLSQRPSPRVRRQVRADVEAAFRASRSGRVGRWLRTPVPLYKGLLAAALVLLLAGAGPALIRSFATRDAPPSTAHVVDTSRSLASISQLY